ncbi:Non-canonical poly(A) RNA polymerase PAPD5 [Mycena indigotica]|uniref:polynucleotide adenylyltransferase n=1 Tax=Mycena indigotica TaxID=2126181 RepID=A0A8H6VZC8_9AGAR|nr:Non-canonical poly(A) RNA polymerase PAPD5 [Mycena indigotica]KAF7297391.1 Non-canonical poly(A) RNA polymerase PAPD5 [Mycena indigotica]
MSTSVPSIKSTYFKPFCGARGRAMELSPGPQSVEHGQSGPLPLPPDIDPRAVEMQGRVGPPPPSKKRKREQEVVEPLVSPWLATIPNTSIMSLDQRMHCEIATFVDYVQQTAQERIARDNLLAVLQRTLRSRLPDGEIKVHGSAVTGLSLPGADLDLVMVTKEEISATEKKRAFYLITSMLKSARISDDVFFQARARVPIVKFKTLPEYGSVNVDLGINNTDGVRAVEIVNGYMSTMPALRPLVMVVKAFLAQRGLNNPATGGLGSYAVICMCISFLQLNPSHRPQDYLDKPLVTESLGALLADFLFYYGLHFPYTTSYISVTLGKVMLKQSADWTASKNPDALVIQCLVNPTNDVGRPTRHIETVKKAFKEAYAQILQLSKEDESLLTPLFALKKSMVDQRAHIHSLVDSGKLATGMMRSSSSASSASSTTHRDRLATMIRSSNGRKVEGEPEAKRAAGNRKPEGSLRRDQANVPYGMGFGSGSLLRRVEDHERAKDRMSRERRSRSPSPRTESSRHGRRTDGTRKSSVGMRAFIGAVPTRRIADSEVWFDSEWPPRRNEDRSRSRKPRERDKAEVIEREDEGVKRRRIIEPFR